MDYSPPGSYVHGISQARILEGVSICYSRGSSWARDGTEVSSIAGKFFTTDPPGKPPYIQDSYKMVEQLKDNCNKYSHL